MSGYIAHLRSDATTGTACGEPWQGWQAPPELEHDPYSRVLPPYDLNPPTHRDSIRQCQACAKCASALTPTQEGAE